MSSSNFRVIIVGGGPAGLTAAHALHQAGIDFVVLERKNLVALDVGASLVIGPQSLRIMDQLGLLDRLLEIGGELRHLRCFTEEGLKFADSTRIQDFRENFGTAPIAFHRAELIQTLYDGLPDKAKQKYVLNKKVAKITTSKDGVQVTCADGSVYEGSIVLGADGVHSTTRRIMRGLALQNDPNAGWDPEVPFTSTYKCLWCSFTRPIQSGEAGETQNQDRSAMFLTGRDRGWIFLYEKLPQPTKERRYYTERDTQEFASRFADMPLVDGLKVADVWAERITEGMADLEEGLLEHWSWDRIVLVGDACHKFTPNAGQGFNSGIQDVVALCNGLRELIIKSNGSPIGTAALQQTFEDYQALRRPDAEYLLTYSAAVTRIHAWMNWVYWFVGRYILPLDFVQKIMLNYVVPQRIKKALVLQYVDIEERVQGRVSWENKIGS